MGDKISVIVPVYNVEKYLDKCVKSIINQTYKNLEIILVDDGSTDYSGKICDEVIKEDKRIKVIHKENGGVSVARNTGIDIATGDYISFVDSDDFVSDAFSEICNEINNKHTEVIIVPLNKDKNRKNEDLISIKDATYTQIIRNTEICISSTWSKFFSREIIGNERFLKGVPIAEDKEFVCRILSKCKEVLIINKPFYNYLIREGSVMNSNRAVVVEKTINSTKIIIDFIDKYDYNNCQKKDLKELFSSNLYWILNAYWECDKKDKKRAKQIIKSNLYLFKYTKNKRKKILLIMIRFLGLNFVMTLINLFKRKSK